MHRMQTLAGLSLSLAALAVSQSSAVGAFTVQVGVDHPMTVTDNGQGDLNPAAGVIDFILTDKDSGDKVVGTARTTGSLSTFVGTIGAQDYIVLTNLTITRTVDSTNAPLVLLAQQSFDNPAAPIKAADGIEGSWKNPGLFLHGGDSLSYQGFVNDHGIGPVYSETTKDTDLNPTAIGKNGDLAAFKDGPSWKLAAQLTVTLVSDDFLVLPSSAEVGIVGVPEPSSFALIGLGALGLLVRAKARHRGEGESLGQ